MKDNMKRAPFSTQIDLSKFDMKDFAKASDEEKRQQEVMGESTTFLKDGLKRLRKNPLAMGSIIVLVLLILVILLAPKIVPYGYADIVKGAQNLGPFQYSEAEQAQIDAGEKLFPHIFGTDELGRDYFIRVVYGAHIDTLMLTFFYRFMPELIKDGHVYLAMPPLYQVTRNKKNYYAYNDDELNKILTECIQKSYRSETVRSAAAILSPSSP